nr:extracellular solute-binding protein [Halapricum hydrolyticum]
MSMTRQRSRRAFLGAVGGGGLIGLAGCLGGDETVTVLSAGSLATAFEDHVGPAFESETAFSIEGEYYGSNAVMGMVTDGTRNPDVVVSADATLLRDRLVGDHTDWDLTFASNKLGLSYEPETVFGEALQAGQPWYELLADAAARTVAISDPEVDPLGYRAWQAFGLAEREHGLNGFRETVWDRVAREPEEPQLLAGVESGARAGAVVYHNMAVDHDLPFEPFPPAYNFADPDRKDHYASASYTFEDGTTVEGRPILYNATVLDRADAPAAGRRLVTFLAEHPELLETAGLAVPESLPRATGTPPEGIPT